MNDGYDELYDLVLKFTDDNMFEVIDWVIEYKKENSIKMFKCKPNLDELEGLLEKALNSMLFRFSSNFQICKEYYEKEISHLMEDEDRSIMRILFQKEDVNGLTKKLWEIRRETSERMQRYEEARKLYLNDIQLLIQEVVDILNNEYSKRIKRTKRAILEYIEPHNTALHKVYNDISEIEKALISIESDSVLSKIDKTEIKRSLEEKMYELRNIKTEEEGNILNTKAFIEEIKKAQNKFKKMIDLLEAKNLEAKTRKTYLHLIKRLDAQIPEMKNIFNDLSEKFKTEIEEIQNAFYLLNMSVKDDLIKSLENQQEISTILGLTGEYILDKINCTRKNILLKESKENVYEVDLSFLE